MVQTVISSVEETLADSKCSVNIEGVSRCCGFRQLDLQPAFQTPSTFPHPPLSCSEMLTLARRNEAVRGLGLGRGKWLLTAEAMEKM